MIYLVPFCLKSFSEKTKSEKKNQMSKILMKTFFEEYCLIEKKKSAESKIGIVAKK